MPRVVDHDQRRREITDACARVIARAGADGATMREVAAEAGRTTGVVTHYFVDKRALLLATYQASLSGRRARRPSADDLGPIHRLRASLAGALPVDADRRRHWLVTLACCLHAGGDPKLAEAQRDAYREFHGHVRSLVDLSGLASDGDDLDEVAAALIARVDGVAMQALFDPESWPAERQLAMLDALMPPH